MTLPASGPITIDMIATELGIAHDGLSLNDSRCRDLAGKPSGTILLSDFYGKQFFPGTITVGLNGSAYGYSSPLGVYSSGSTSFGSLVYGQLDGKTISELLTINSAYYLTLPGNYQNRFIQLSVQGNTYSLKGGAPATYKGITQTMFSTTSATNTNFIGKVGQTFPIALTLT